MTQTQTQTQTQTRAPARTKRIRVLQSHGSYGWEDLEFFEYDQMTESKRAYWDYVNNTGGAYRVIVRRVKK